VTFNASDFHFLLNVPKGVNGHNNRAPIGIQSLMLPKCQLLLHGINALSMDQMSTYDLGIVEVFLLPVRNRGTFSKKFYSMITFQGQQRAQIVQKCFESSFGFFAQEHITRPQVTPRTGS
jgi:hypothetical protein